MNVIYMKQKLYENDKKYFFFLLKIDVFSNLLLHQKIKISVFGMFEINKVYIHSVNMQKKLFNFWYD